MINVGPASEEDEKSSQAPLPFTAWNVNPAINMPIVPADRARNWMDNTHHHFANRCLPLLMANQSGWFVLNSHRIAVTWGGLDAIESLMVTYLSGQPPYTASSHFGSGILTFTIPYLFRTPPGYNLLARGPANMPKDGISPLEGVIETDWTDSTFTMNWKVTRPHQTIIFEVGEPILMIVPQARGELERFQPEVRDITSDPATNEAYWAWANSRRQFMDDLNTTGSEAHQQGWQKHYMRGTSTADPKTRRHEHQQKLDLSDFADRTPPAET